MASADTRMLFGHLFLLGHLRVALIRLLLSRYDPWLMEKPNASENKLQAQQILEPITIDNQPQGKSASSSVKTCMRVEGSCGWMAEGVQGA